MNLDYDIILANHIALPLSPPGDWNWLYALIITAVIGAIIIIIIWYLKKRD